MSKHVTQILDWQRRFAAQPKVFMTVDKNGDMTGDAYESRQAAECEVAFALKHGRRLGILAVNVHSLKLAQERWESANWGGA